MTFIQYSDVIEVDRIEITSYANCKLHRHVILCNLQTSLLSANEVQISIHVSIRLKHRQVMFMPKCV